MSSAAAYTRNPSFTLTLKLDRRHHQGAISSGQNIYRYWFISGSESKFPKLFIDINFYTDPSKLYTDVGNQYGFYGIYFYENEQMWRHNKPMPINKDSINQSDIDTLSKVRFTKVKFDVETPMEDIQIEVYLKPTELKLVNNEGTTAVGGRSKSSSKYTKTTSKHIDSKGVSRCIYTKIVKGKTVRYIKKKGTDGKFKYTRVK